MDFAKIIIFAFIYKNICICHKKAIPLHRQLKKKAKIYLTYSRLYLIHKSLQRAKIQKINDTNK